MTLDTADSRPASAPPRDVPVLLPSLTGARFIAAGLVFAFHAAYAYPFAADGPREKSQFLFAEGGNAGVSFFFMLSGFVLAWAVRTGDTAPKFWRRRFFKIYPNHLITFLAAAVLFGWVIGTGVDGSDGVLQLLLLQSWHPDLNVRISYNPVAWSLSCEAFFYFAFPFLIKLIDRIRPERLWFWAGVSAASVISIPMFAILLPSGGELFPPGFTSSELWFVDNLPPVQLLTFVFGILLAKVVLTGRHLPLELGGAVALAVGSYFVTPLFGADYQFSAIMVLPLGLLIAAAAAADIERRPTFLGTRPMIWLGEISFAFYLWHFLVLTAGHQVLGAGEDWSTATAAAVMVLLLAVALVLSWATYRFFERPIMKRFGTSRRNRALAADTPAPAGATA